MRIRILSASPSRVRKSMRRRSPIRAPSSRLTTNFCSGKQGEPDPPLLRLVEAHEEAEENDRDHVVDAGDELQHETQRALLFRNVLHPQGDRSLGRAEGRHGEHGHGQAKLRVRGKPDVKQAVQADGDEKEDTASVQQDPEVARTAEHPKGSPLELDAREEPDPPKPDDEEGTYLFEGRGVQDAEKRIPQQVADQEKLRARKEEEAACPGREDLDEALAVARECEDGEKKDGSNGLQGLCPLKASSLRWRRTPQPHGGFVPGSIRCPRGNEKRIPLLPFAIPPTVRSIVSRACSRSSSSFMTEMRILL